MTEKFSYEQWRRECTNLIKTKENIQEMSKLYIICHEKVKKIIRRCQTDLQYNPMSDCQKQLQFIRVVLERLAQRQNDEYLSKIDPKVLDKYEKNFYDLIELMRLALATNDSKQKIDILSLQGISEDKHTKNGQFSLRGELKKSENRMVRTKSGHRVTKPIDGIKLQKKVNDQAEFQELLEKSNKIEMVDLQKHEEQFIERKTRLEKIINSHIDKKGYTLDFRKKYDKLDDYLQERKSFSDLIFSQKYYDEMIEMSKNRKNEAKTQEKKDPDLNKIFPEFNIKTKYMKKQVKQNILQVIFDVKKELLKQYHESNVTKMRETNEGGMVKLNFRNKQKKNNNRSEASSMSSSQKTQKRFRSTNRLFEKRRHSLVNLRDAFRNTNIEWKKEDYQKKQEQKAFQMFSQSKMPHYQKI